MDHPAVHAHDFAQGRAAAQASAESGRPLILVHSAHGLGLGWLKQLCAQAEAAAPGARLLPLLDCADASGLALGALRLGYGLVRLDGGSPAYAAVAEIAGRQGAQLLADLPPALDLARQRDVLAACRLLLG